MTETMTGATTDRLSHYRLVETASNQMLAAVRRQDWDALIEAEARCAGVIARLRAAEAEVRMDEHERGQKAQIIRRVLAHDAEIRRLLDPRMHELEHLLNAAGTRRRVDDAYRV
jgi:flagellar protein FliT